MIQTQNDRNTRHQDTKITGADSVNHLTGPDNTFAKLDR